MCERARALATVLVCIWIGLEAQSARIYQTASAMCLGSVTSDTNVFLMGLSIPTDGWGGCFYYDSNSSAATNSGNLYHVFKPVSANGRWIRQKVLPWSARIDMLETDKVDSGHGFATDLYATGIYADGLTVNGLTQGGLVMAGAGGLLQNVSGIVTINGNLKTPPVTVSGNVVDASAGQLFKTTLSTNMTFTITNLDVGQTLILCVSNPASWTVSFANPIAFYPTNAFTSTPTNADTFSFWNIIGSIEGQILQRR